MSSKNWWRRRCRSCPKIQEEILLINTDKILQITERKIRDIAKEIDWQKQIILWNNLA